MSISNQFEVEAPIIQKTGDLYREFYGYLKLFPKKDQYLLGKRCEDMILSFLEGLMLAATVSKDRKLIVLQNVSAKFDTLKMLLRTSRDLKLIDNKKYLSLEIKIQEIGRMLGGWLKSSIQKAP